MHWSTRLAVSCCSRCSEDTALEPGRVHKPRALFSSCKSALSTSKPRSSADGMIHSILLEFAQSVNPDALPHQLLLDEDGAALEWRINLVAWSIWATWRQGAASDQKLGDGGGDTRRGLANGAVYAVGSPRCSRAHPAGDEQANLPHAVRPRRALWSRSPTPLLHNQDVQMVSSSVQIGGGEIANNLVQLMIVGVLGIFLSVIAPEDLDSAEARKYIGPLLAVSDVCDTCVAFNVFQAYHASRSEGAAQSYERRVCLYIHYALVAFFYYWGVVYPTMVWFFYKNSWWRLRTGLVIDACVFLTAIGLLWWHGETRYPPGTAAACRHPGRPTVSLLVAAVFTRENRRRLVGGAPGSESSTSSSPSMNSRVTRYGGSSPSLATERRWPRATLSTAAT